MRVLVCGSRHFNDFDLMLKILSENFNKGDILIHGDAKGADRLSEYVARFYLFADDVIGVERYPADWNLHGKRAGPIRNHQMLTEGKPDLVIAFIAVGSRGTKHMVEIAKKAGIPVKEIQIA